MIACENGHEEVVRVLVEEGGADIDKPDNDGYTPCHVVAQNGHVDVVRLLHEYGADIHKAAKNGQTPLQIARENNKAEDNSDALYSEPRPFQE